MIVNINYKGVLADHADLANIQFDFKKTPPPTQKILRFQCDDKCATMIIFPSGKCRVMGIKKPLTCYMNLPLKVEKLKIQSITITTNFHSDINLIKLAKVLPPRSFWFEPEIFPALRLLCFNPLCVNIFASGKVVIMGLKHISKHDTIVRKVLRTINNAYILSMTN